MSSIPSPVGQTNGIVGGYQGDDVVLVRAMIAFSAIAWYNSVELIFLVFLRFKRWKGLYFWSLMITSWAILIYQIGSFGKMNNILPDPVPMTVFTNVGWVFMIGGNSLVLYSRLHLLTQNQTLLRCVLWGILINTVVMYIPTTALDVGSNIVHHDWATYVDGYNVMERIQMTMFTIQEFVISGIYLVEAYRYLKIVYVGDKSSRNIMYELLAVNVAIIILDIALLVVSYRDLFAIEVTFKGFVYSVKLKLELGVLSRLVRIVTKNSSALQHTNTWENDLANIANGPKAFNGLDFSTSPLASEHIEKTKTSTDTTQTNSNDTSRDRKSRQSVPWLSLNSPPAPVYADTPAMPPISRGRRGTFASSLYPTTTRDSKRSGRGQRQDSAAALSPTTKAFNDQVLRRHAIVQRGESYANSEFLTSAAVTEGANDENIRQFQREIEAELGGGEAAAKLVRQCSHGVASVAGAEKTEAAKHHEAGEKRRKSELGLEAGNEEEDGEEEWQRDLGVLGRMNSGVSGSTPQVARKPVLSRESSLGNLYPGRITGEKA